MKEQATAKQALFGLRLKWINPVLDKEFRLRMRSPRTMWTLFFYLLAIGLLSFSAIFLTQEMNGGGVTFNPENSKMLFYFLSIGQLGLIAFMAPGLTAGVISGEREKQTLNLLLTTQQSSSTIILSKLVSSLSFMILIVISTIPVYSMMFLYGGVSPKQLLLVFLFYLFMMLMLGSLGVLFSTLFKRTMLAVIVTYGITLFIFAGTAILYYLMTSFVQQTLYQQGVPSGGNYEWTGHIMAWNPVVAMLSILDPSITESVYNVSNRGGAISHHLALWKEFMMIYVVISAAALWISIQKLRPRLRAGRK